MTRHALALMIAALSAGACTTGTDVPLEIPWTQLAMALPDSSYEQPLVAVGGVAPYTWSLATGSAELPPGLTLASDGAIEGVAPSVHGIWDFRVRVSDREGDAAERDLRLTVRPLLAPSERCRDFPRYAIPTFADSVLEGAVRAELGAGSTLVTCTRLTAVRSLVINDRGLADLAGIQNLTELISLDIARNSVVVVSPLENLGVTSLSVASNPIVDLSPIGRLRFLSSLYLSFVGLTDFGPLGAALSEASPNLARLSLSGNGISDLTPLHGFSRLRDLHLESMGISDLSPLSGMVGLVGLRLSGNPITDLSPLAGLVNLQTLDLNDIAIGDLTTLPALQLITLTLAGNSLDDLSRLSAIPYLVRLNVDRNLITDFSDLAGLRGLGALYAEGNQVVNLGGLEALHLFELDLDDNPSLSDVDLLIEGRGLSTSGTKPRVSLRSTAVSCADVASLRGRGIQVDSDCP